MAWDVSTAVAREMGDNGPWVRHIAYAWRAAATDSNMPGVPRDPTNSFLECWDDADNLKSGGAHARLLAYWNPLLHLTRYGLGWARPDVGLLRWRDGGYAAVDPVLRMVARWWPRERLEDFLAWATTCDHLFETMATEIRDVAQLAPTTAFRPHAAPEWERRRQQPAWNRVWTSGKDSLHLRDHAGTPIGMGDVGGVDDASVFTSNGGHHRVLLTDTYSTWYRQLMEANGDVTVDVVCKPVGWLGTYRCSPNTELWHRSDEDTHLLGN